jgi:uncharacterized protein (DUF849 family)
MEVIDPREMRQPNLCLFCEMTPDPGSRVIDTLRDLNIGGVPATADQEAMDMVTHLSGRKYLCEGCVHDFALAMDWTRPEDVETLASEVKDLTEQLEALKRSSTPAFAVVDALKAANVPLDAVATDGAKATLGPVGTLHDAGEPKPSADKS